MKKYYEELAKWSWEVALEINDHMREKLWEQDAKYNYVRVGNESGRWHEISFDYDDLVDMEE